MPKKILIIDDDKIVRKLVAQTLEDNGYQHIAAINGAQGLEIAHDQKPDGIILDRIMPGIDGNQVLIELKENEDTKHIPVIMLTSRDNIEDISASLELGAMDYIVKPFDEDNLIIRLENMFRRTK